jgi:hypothetical protein
MTDDINRKEALSEDDLAKVSAAADAKQRRHRVDEYVAMIFALSVVFVLWFLQYLGLY